VSNTICSTHTVGAATHLNLPKQHLGEFEGRQYDSLRKCGNAKVC
jgi:hypothetical protein